MASQGEPAPGGYRGEMPSGDEPTLLITAPSEWRAELIAGVLRERGVGAVVMGGYLAGLRAEAPASASVMVPARDLARAQELLAEARAASIDIDWDEVDVGEGEEALDVKRACPRCGYDHAGLGDGAACPECGTRGMEATFAPAARVILVLVVAVIVGIMVAWGLR